MLQHYCESFWFSRNERWSTYLRIQVGHQCAIASFTEEKLQLSFSSIDCKLFVALIQDADYGVAGLLWDLYFHAEPAEHYTTVLDAHPKLKHIALVVVDRVIKCFPKEKPPTKKQVRAVPPIY